MNPMPKHIVRGRLLDAEPMAKHTTWRVGGPADVYFEPADLDDLTAFLATANATQAIVWLGLGSNLLVRDGGIRGVVIATKKGLGHIDKGSSGQVRAEAGVPCAKLARKCAAWALGPAAFFAGIPGTVGGALAMNAGAFGGETWDHVTAVETVDRDGQIKRRERKEFEIGYRSVGRPAEEWFVAAEFDFAGSDDAGADGIRRMLARRNESQPIGVASCGSVFRNPPDDHAARLIEACGLKGHRVGGAIVSEKHANFIVNTGDATAADVESLIEFVQGKVVEQQGVELHREVRIIGEVRHD